MLALCDVISGCHQNKHINFLICLFTTCSCCLCYDGIEYFCSCRVNWVTMPQDKIPSSQQGQKADQIVSVTSWSQILMEYGRKEIWQEEENRIISFCDIPEA